jgi:hypothetical protein
MNEPVMNNSESEAHWKSEPLGQPQDDPAYKRAKAILEARAKLDADRAKRTRCCKNHSKPYDKKKSKEARKARKINKRKK